MLRSTTMRLIARTASLLAGAAILGLCVNTARPDGISIFAWSPPAECESAGEIAEVTPIEAQSLCTDPSILVIDVRSHEQFANGHIPQALHLPCSQGKISGETFEQLGAASSLLVYGQSTEEARAVAESLAQRALPVRILQGGYQSWEAAGLACTSGPCEGCVGRAHDH
jgi:hydroxyacylglutathione hydrolase